MADLALECVSRCFGKGRFDGRFREGRWAVRDVSFAVASGQWLALVGPSGSGKTTLLRMVAGLEPVNRGTIRIGGRVVNNLPPHARNIAMVFQGDALYTHWSVYKNIAFGLQLRKAELTQARAVGADQIRKAVRDAAASLGIERFLERMPHELSGGEQQRVSV
ncbi:MAG: ABC transporter ATP-binding protein, partial [Pirellulales bacterium]